MEFDWGNIQDALTENNVPELILAAAGVLALLIVVTYLKDKRSALYKLTVLLGIIAGILLIVVSVDTYGQWALSTSVIAVAAAFALVIRPFKDIQIAVLVGLFAIVMAYLFLGNLAGGDLEMLSEGWPRIAIAVAAGVIMFTVSNFIQAVVRLFGSILNFWPVLLVLGLVCIAEAVCVYMGYGSVYDMIRSHLNASSEVLVAYMPW